MMKAELLDWFEEHGAWARRTIGRTITWEVAAVTRSGESVIYMSSTFIEALKILQEMCEIKEKNYEDAKGSRGSDCIVLSRNAG